MVEVHPGFVVADASDCIDVVGILWCSDVSGGKDCVNTPWCCCH